MARHGQTDSNAAKRIMGQRIDEPLNATGRQQAEDLAVSIQKLPFDIIFSSPLKRAEETARIIALGRNIPVVLRDELKERDFGSISGKSWEEADALSMDRSGGLKSVDTHLEYDYRPYGGESAEDVKKRLSDFVAEIKTTYSDKRVLVVAHGGIIRFSHLLFRDRQVDHIKNASIEEFDI